MNPMPVCDDDDWLPVCDDDDWRHSGAHRTHCIWVFAIAWTVGVLALLCDYLQSSKVVIAEMHALFALLSCLAIGLLLMPAWRNSENASPRQLYLFVRWGSRWVYVFAYLLAAVRVSLFLYETCRAAGTRTSLNGSLGVRPMDDFQFYVLCCLGPLWLLRIASQMRTQGD